MNQNGDRSETNADAPAASAAGRSPRRKRSLKRNILFSGVVLLTVLAVAEAALAVIGVKPSSAEDPFVGFAGYSRLFEPVDGDGGAAMMRTSRAKLDWFNDQSFPATKPAETYRIFCLGGSTTVGRPYDDATSFSRWLRELTARFGKGREYEVINAGGISYASYRVARVMQELAEYEPDLFIVYTGHNEFLERHTYSDLLETSETIRGVASLLSRTRIFSVAQRVVRGQSGAKSRDTRNRNVLPEDVDAILDRSIGPQSYHRDRAQREQVEQQFRNSLERMIETAREAGAEIMFVQPSANLRDCSPFKSEHDEVLAESQLQRWRQLVQEGQRHVANSQWTAAAAAFQRATQVDGRVAELHFLRGQALWQAGQYSESREAFELALMEDVCPLRVLPSLQLILTETAQTHDVLLVDFAGEIDSLATHGIPGSDYFLDHVHPTIEGHQILAGLLFEKLSDEGIVAVADDYSEVARDTLFARLEAEVDTQAHAIALRNLAKVMVWAGKFADADRLALAAAEDLPNDAEAQFLAGNAHQRDNDHDRAIAYFKAALRLNPTHAQAHNNLGNEYFVLGELDAAALHFGKAVQFDPSLSLGHHNLGVIALEQGDAARGEQHVAAALDADPYSFDSHWLMSKILYQQQRFGEAAAYMEKAVQLRPTDSAAQADLEMLRRLQRDAG